MKINHKSLNPKRYPYPHQKKGHDEKKESAVCVSFKQKNYLCPR